MTINHKNSGGNGNALFACVFVSFGVLQAQQIKVSSNGGDGVLVSQGGRLVGRQGCTFGPCAKSGVVVDGLGSSAEIIDCELRSNGMCGMRVVNGSEVTVQKNRINGNVYGLHVGNGSPADIIQNSFENNKSYHLFVQSSWFPVEEHDMVNISNTETEGNDDCSFSARLNIVKQTKTWTKGRKYSIHGTQAFMDILTEKTKERGAGGGTGEVDQNPGSVKPKPASTAQEG